ncbi:MAG: hypothetical protein AB1791_04965 [Chloroflexota bacterium]
MVHPLEAFGPLCSKIGGEAGSGGRAGQPAAPDPGDGEDVLPSGRAVLAALREYQGPAEQFDDMTLLVVAVE